jgi:hypothetical protein
MLVKCEVKDCKYNMCHLEGFICDTKGYVCSKDSITLGYGNKNGEWVFAECMDYIKRSPDETI